MPDDLPAAYREEVVPLASVLTPNQFEAEKLVGFPLSSEAEALRACEVLMSQGPHTIVSPYEPLPICYSCLWDDWG